MGKSFYENFPLARAVFEEGSDSCSVDFKKLCFEGPESDLTLTENLQPSLLLTSVAAFRVAEKELEFTPQVCAGHSLGEYSALVASGAITLWDAARLVRARGQAMQKAVPEGLGKMAALLGGNDEQVAKLCADATATAIKNHPESELPQIVEPANFNAPGQIVISGTKEAVEIATAMAKDLRIKALPLNVSAPFHCKLMKPARDSMNELLQKTKISDLKNAYIPNRTARISRESENIASLLSEQIDHVVLWKQSMLTALSSGHTQFIEFGSGNVLSGLMKRIAKDQPSADLLKLAGVTDVESLQSSIKEIAGWK
ncbi:MAG: ACP S-malonyltransferase [Xanthomonadaceae bacterium]|nr:ACP S-malonyltransferase [Xanthomonadaceae bacterium]